MLLSRLLTVSVSLAELPTNIERVKAVAAVDALPAASVAAAAGTLTEKASGVVEAVGLITDV